MNTTFSSEVILIILRQWAPVFAYMNDHVSYYIQRNADVVQKQATVLTFNPFKPDFTLSSS